MSDTMRNVILIFIVLGMVGCFLMVVARRTDSLVWGIIASLLIGLGVFGVLYQVVRG